MIMTFLCMLGTVILWSTNAFLIWDNDNDAFQQALAHLDPPWLLFDLATHFHLATHPHLATPRWVKTTSAGSFFAYLGIWLLSVWLTAAAMRVPCTRDARAMHVRCACHACMWCTRGV